MSVEPGSAALKTALKFTSDDLAANREGRISAAQVARLKRDRRRAALIGAAILVVVVLLATTALFIGQMNQTPVLTLIGVAITICGAVASGMIVRNWYRLTGDIERGTVQTLDGMVQHTVRVAGRSATYVLKVGNDEIVVPKAVFLSLQNGAHYRFYRTPVAKALLSAEAR